MPKVQVGDIEMYYEIHGAGEPVLMILSPGAPVALWGLNDIIPALAREFRVVAFDNRGAGQTDAPQTPYSMEGFADDAAGLLAALGIQSAAVVGASMGGAIALELVLRHPQRVRALVLSSAPPGGNHQVLSPQVREFQRAWAVAMKQPESPEAQRAFLPFMLAAETGEKRPDQVEELVRFMISLPVTPPYVHDLQTAAIRAWAGSYERLSQIGVPTLVLTGDQDMAVAPENARILHEAIAGSELQVIPNLGHYIIGDAAEAVYEAILSFLRRVGKGKA